MNDQNPSDIRSILVTAMIATVVVTLDVSVVNIAIPGFGRSFGVAPAEAQWAMNAYTLAFASLLLNGGALVDRWGTRNTFVAGFAIFVLASLGCGAATAWWAFLAARAVEGVGAALLIPAALAMIQRGIPDPAARALAIGWWAAAGSGALAAGPVVGGALVTTLGWRSIFLANIPVGLFGIWLAGRHAPLQVRATGRAPDIAGQAAALAMLACVVLAISEAGRWFSGVTVAALLIGGLFFAWLLARIERSVEVPMIPPELFARATFVAAIVTGAIINFAFYGIVFLLSLYFQTDQHRNALQAGIALVPMMFVLIVVNLSAGWLDRTLGSQRTIVAGLSVMTLGFVLLAAVAGVTTLGPMLPGLVLIGVGTAAAVPATVTLALAGMPVASGGIASGVLNATRQVGGALGVALFSALLGAHDLVAPALRTASIVAAGVGLLTAGLAELQRRAMPQVDTASPGLVRKAGR